MNEKWWLKFPNGDSFLKVITNKPALNSWIWNPLDLPYYDDMNDNGWFSIVEIDKYNHELTIEPASSDVVKNHKQIFWTGGILDYRMEPQKNAKI